MTDKELKSVEKVSKDLKFAESVMLCQFIVITVLVFCIIKLSQELAGYRWSAESEARVACQDKGGRIFNDRCVDKKIFIEEDGK